MSENSNQEEKSRSTYSHKYASMNRYKENLGPEYCQRQKANDTRSCSANNRKDEDRESRLERKLVTIRRSRSTSAEQPNKSPSRGRKKRRNRSSSRDRSREKGNRREIETARHGHGRRHGRRELEARHRQMQKRVFYNGGTALSYILSNAGRSGTRYTIHAAQDIHKEAYNLQELG